MCAVMLGIRIGAAEFLEKPLCTLKLKNIWQHVVRRMMVAGGGRGTGKAGGAGHPAQAGSQYQQASRRFSYTHPSSAAAPRPRAPLATTSRVRSLSQSLDASLVAPGQHHGGGAAAAGSLPSPLHRLGSPDVQAEEGPTLLNLPSSPLTTSGLFSSPAASSASCEFLLEPLPSSCAAGEVDSRPAPTTAAPPSRPGSTKPAAADKRRQSREQQHHQQCQLSAPTQDSTPHPTVAASNAPTPLPPPPPPDLACSTSAHGPTTCELPPPPPLCAPGMPWCPPAILLPPGQEWGMPMNPMAVAPGITPPIFPPPVAAAPNSLPCVPPPPLPLPPAPGVPTCMPSHTHNAELMPLPMHLLSAACGMPAPHAAPQQPFQHQHEGTGANSAPCNLLQR